ncbi:Hydrogenobyrinate a,c-diamide synthase [Candidatus Hodgkinia cicadicola]|nr:Hydrogenobyrinate a,c-diamide synthase [Candidatus Hodgkinia cicadicola]
MFLRIKIIYTCVKFSYMLILCALRSSEGKTQFACSLAINISLIKSQIEICKIGPDYIDIININQIRNNTFINIPIRIDYKIITWLLWIGKIGLIEDNMGLLDNIIQTSAINTYTLLANRKNKFILILNCATGQQTNVCTISILWPLISWLILNNIASYKHENLLVNEFKSSKAPPICGILYRNTTIVMKQRHLGLIQFVEINLTKKSYFNLLIKWTFIQCNMKWILIV